MNNLLLQPSDEQSGHTTLANNKRRVQERSERKTAVKNKQETLVNDKIKPID